MTPRFTFVLATAIATFTGCLADSGTKGDEDDIPVDGKDDSFGEPTAHGSLVFGIPSQASFTDTEGFHSWTFELTADADVELTTALQAQNLDTVLYLYKKQTSDASWGAYIARNDDANADTAASQLTKTLDAGQYRVLVKAYKRTQRGSFSLAGACTGEGCPRDEVCEADAALPIDSGHGEGCGSKFAAIYQTGVVTSSSTIEFALETDDRCTIPALQRTAIDYYLSYWEEFSPVDSAASLEVETQVIAGVDTTGGTLIHVGDGGDESAITFVFDRGNELVALYQHNQSPDVRFYCKAAAAPVVDLPNIEDCMSALVSSVPHTTAEEVAVSITASANNLPVGIGAEVSRSMQRYVTTSGASSSTTQAVEGSQWSVLGAKASRLTIKANNRPSSGFVATSEMVLLEAPSNKPAALVCD